MLLLSLIFGEPIAAETQTSNEVGDCDHLIGLEISPDDIGLETTGATITSVSYKVVDDLSIEGSEYCEVIGSIHPVDPEAPDINFQVNLPTEWNKKFLQFGGGGFNGTVISGLGNIAGGDNEPKNTPLAQGFVTFGSDSGHTVNSHWDAEWAMNDEALENFASDQLKKTKDVALAIADMHYNTVPEQVYFAGGSEGGREALKIVQLFPEEYDGVISVYPVLNWIPKAITDNRNVQFMYDNDGEGWISPEENDLINETVMEKCDSLDGVEDGIISNISECAEKEQEILDSLRCTDGNSEDQSCLSDKQIEVVKMFNSSMNFDDIPLANDFSTMPGYSQLQGADIGSRQFGTRAAAPNPLVEGKDGVMGVYADGVIRYKVTRDPELDMKAFHPNEYSEEIFAASQLLDATNPDISKFKESGGKLILLHGTTDEVVTPYGSIDYYNNLVDVFGESLDQFVQFYMVPGYGHGGGDFSMNADLLEALDTWVVSGEAPTNLVAEDQNPETPERTRPLCEYPTFPQYDGEGDVDSADSYACVEPGESMDINASGIKDLLENFEAEGEFANNGAARSLEAHIDTMIRFEARDANDKVIKHTEKFMKLLDNHHESELISDHAHSILMDNANALIDTLQ